ncbi:MAG: polysaccharide deacetylase family protein [Phycisphaerales bacterium]|nr:polysaccharide deacetylase family protein [Phycisphaerales bacterium]
MDPLILLSFDIEEFDAPFEFQHPISEEDQIAVSTEGHCRILSLLERHNIPATFFTTAFFALQESTLIASTAEQHEIASHAYNHSEFEDTDLVQSRRVLQRISNQPINGYRSPRMGPVDQELLTHAGYLYNSSDNPIWLPGRYNNFTSPRTANFNGDLLNIPASASPILRIPLFWLAFRHLPMWLIRMTAKRVLQHDGYVVLYFHPWEFVELKNWGLPWLMHHGSGDKLLNKLDHFVSWIGKHGRFGTFTELDRRMRSQDRT